MNHYIFHILWIIILLQVIIQQKLSPIYNLSHNNTSTNSIKILTYNIHNMPWHNKNLFLLENYIEKYDIIFLQEFYTSIFSIKHKLNFIKHINNKYNIITTDGIASLYNIDAGLAIISKYPIKNINFISYQSCYSVDCFANKGLLYGDVIINNETYTIGNTHMNDCKNGCRNKYTKQHLILQKQNQVLNSFIENNKNKQIIGGDFNYDSSLVENSNLKSINTSTFIKNKSNIDYFYIKNINSNTKLNLHKFNQYSDHYAVSLIIDI